MRKVIYTEWICGIQDEEYKKLDPIDRIGKNPFKEGTNCNIEKEGLFHGFFPATMGSSDRNGPTSFGNYTEALIETAEGFVISVHPGSIRFVDSPDVEQRAEFAKAAMQGILATNAEYLFGNTNVPVPCEVARQAVMNADALIAELKNQKQ